MTAPEQALSAAALKILRALVRVLLRYGMPFEGFAELAKRVYIEVASKDFAINGRKQSISRISTLTGIYRREVSRILELPAINDADITARHNRAARVIGGWLHDPEYSDADGHARTLTLAGDTPNFTHLVRKYSGDIPTRAILDELTRVGAVNQDKDGNIQLQSRAYVPKHGEADMIGILGTDVTDFISTIDHNLQHDEKDSRLQLKVVYDNLPQEAIDEFRTLASRRGRELLEEFNTWLAEHDRDTNPDSQGTGSVRAGLGIYYIEEDTEKESQS
ncbi:MAG: DUF6502 family protein [Gammaproteobacteria bacterium]|nr:DUF6502 family protein [Gammaproteobacteria bacterium]